MGATDFYQVAVGKDVRAAFSMAQEEARYEYGNCGYTGSVAEKSGYRFIQAPTGCRAGVGVLVDWISHACCDELQLVPKQYRSWAKQFAAAYEDKWGKALALELPYAQAAKFKAENGLKGTRKKVFAFFGVASC